MSIKDLSLPLSLPTITKSDVHYFRIDIERQRANRHYNHCCNSESKTTEPFKPKKQQGEQSNIRENEKDRSPG